MRVLVTGASGFVGGVVCAQLLEPDCVVHLAAEIASQRDAKKIHEINVGAPGGSCRPAKSAASDAGTRRGWLPRFPTAQQGVPDAIAQLT